MTVKLKNREIEAFENWCDENYKLIENHSLEDTIELFREYQQSEWIAYAY